MGGSGDLDGIILGKAGGGSEMGIVEARGYVAWTGNSRFLTGLSARFGMTRMWGERLTTES
jgi:hypothetical protein